MANTLKLHDTELVLPGLALPEAFESLEKRFDSTIKLCKLNTPHDSQVLSVITICQELQRLLKCAFIENGFLASRMEIFTQYHADSLKKMNKTVSAFDVEHKVTKKQIKRLRKKITVHDTYQRRNNEKWWNVEVRSTDYETFNTLSRSIGSPDLEFMLRINQILIDFVRDEERTELLLPPMGHEERAELSKLASIYKIRCRYGKSTQLASSTLMKARQTCIPGHGEVDAILDGFARAKNLKRLTVSSEEVVEDTKHEVVVTAEDISLSGKGKSKSPPISTIPSTMLTPLSSLTSPTIDISGITSASLTPSQSPPTSGLSTPTAADHMMRGRRDSSDKERASAKNRSRCGSLSENPLPGSVAGAVASSRSGKSMQSSRSSPSKSPRPPSTSSAVGGVASGNEAPPPPLPPAPQTVGPPLTSLQKPSSASAASSSSSSASSLLITSTSAQKQPLPHPSAPPPPPSPLPVATAQHLATPTGSQAPPPTTASTSLLSPIPRSPGGGIPSSTGGVQHHHHAPHHHHAHHHAPLSRHPTVVASPLKVPVSQLPHVIKHSLGASSGSMGGAGGGAKGGDHEGGGADEGGGGGEVGEGGGGGKKEGISLSWGTTQPPPKRIRLTRKTAGLGNAED